MTAVRLRVRGRVQGVGFRAWLVRTATAAGVAGWVRNRGDGSVEALLQGRAEAVAAVVRACGRGPAGAAVSGVDEVAAAEEALSGFAQRPTEG